MLNSFCLLRFCLVLINYPRMMLQREPLACSLGCYLLVAVQNSFKWHGFMVLGNEFLFKFHMYLYRFLVSF